MEKRSFLSSYRVIAVVTTALLATSVSFGQASRPVRVLRSGDATLSNVASESPTIGNPEIDPAVAGDDGTDVPLSGGKMVNRSIATQVGTAPTVPGSGKAKSNPELAFSFQ